MNLDSGAASLRANPAARSSNVAAFLALAFGFSWIVWLGVWWSAGRPTSLTATPMLIAVYAGSFGPGLAGAVVSAHEGRLREWVAGFLRWRMGWAGAAAIALPLPLAVLGLTVALGYLQRHGPASGDDPVFADAHGQPLRYIAVKETFDRLVGKAGIRPSSARRPRLHDLRHTFAVRALQDSPTGRNRCGAHMVALATYMGHVNIYATYWYLEATADLVRDIAMAGDAFKLLIALEHRIKLSFNSIEQLLLLAGDLIQTSRDQPLHARAYMLTGDILISGVDNRRKICRIISGAT